MRAKGHRNAKAGVDIVGAQKKLRQAEFFLGHLEHTSTDWHRHQNGERLEFYFSACLTAAQSVFYVLDATGGETFKEIQRRWRARLPEPERSRFGRMIGLRDNDVHLATTGAETLHKYVGDDLRARAYGGYHYAFFESAVFGPPAVVEETNPDGTKVAGRVLRGVVGLYLEQQGRRIEASDACREFIGQLQSLVDAVKAANPQATGGTNQ